jgi:hypothetical protein
MKVSFKDMLTILDLTTGRYFIVESIIGIETSGKFTYLEIQSHFGDQPL